ncbi:MAG: DUF364 domain-containing protein [Candidatus Hatepunaea meridiana]|nr:DUF364 domain-containing protein [Candidatus Hatepunaea meridiana]
MITEKIIKILPDIAEGHIVVDVRLGLKYIGVKLDDGSCGVGYKFPEDTRCKDISFPDDDRITGRKASELLSWLGSEEPLLRSIGLATANALLVHRCQGVPELRRCEERSDEAISLSHINNEIASLRSQRRGSGTVRSGSTAGNSVWEMINGDILSVIDFRTDDKVVIIGYFEPIVKKIKDKCNLKVYELDTSLAPGLLESSEGAKGLINCDIALITSTSIVNNTLDPLLQAANGCREVALLGPSTPLVPEVFEGTPVTLLSGIIPTSDEILSVISEGGGMRRFKPYVRKVNYRLK